eukprot:scaffold1_cov402-Prasinococcus_capsulatus_cf.AAC.60
MAVRASSSRPERREGRCAGPCSCRASTSHSHSLRKRCCSRRDASSTLSSPLSKSLSSPSSHLPSTTCALNLCKTAYKHTGPTFSQIQQASSWARSFAPCALYSGAPRERPCSNCPGQAMISVRHRSASAAQGPAHALRSARWPCSLPPGDGGALPVETMAHGTGPELYVDSGS